MTCDIMSSAYVQAVAAESGPLPKGEAFAAGLTLEIPESMAGCNFLRSSSLNVAVEGPVQL